MKKPSGLRNAIAKRDGYYSPKGEKLKGASLSQAEVDAWNGVKEEAAPAPVVKEVVVEEAAPSVEDDIAIEITKSETVLDKVFKKVSRKKK